MKILISGICGFTGAALASGLLERGGVQITGFDNLSRPGSRTNLPRLEKLGIPVPIGDVRDRAFLDSLPPCDWILDCAADPSVLSGLSSPSLDLVHVNLMGTVHLLELCRRWRAGFILLSTSRVYSINHLRRLDLEESPTRFRLPEGAQGPGWTWRGIQESFSTSPPLSLYGSTKLCSEWLALEYAAAFGFPVWINRCGVLAGPGQFGKADQGIFSFWIHSWHARRPLRYIGFGGTGRQVRDALHPSDLARLISLQLSNPASDAPRLCNVSGGLDNSLSLQELSSWCRERFPHLPSPLVPSADSEIRAFDIPWLVLDSAAARRAWNWEPAVSKWEILEQIALHAESHPGWLDLCSPPAA